MSYEIISFHQVEPTINTGNNLRKELERLEEVVDTLLMHQNATKLLSHLVQVQLFYKFRNDEIFRRINVNNLVRITILFSRLLLNIGIGRCGCLLR